MAFPLRIGGLTYRRPSIRRAPSPRLVIFIATKRGVLEPATVNCVAILRMSQKRAEASLIVSKELKLIHQRF